MKRNKLIFAFLLIFFFLFSISFAANNELNKKLLEAIKKNDLQLVQKLIKSGADINFKDEKGLTPLHYAAVSGNIDLVKYLVENGADVCAKDKKGRTPDYYAFRYYNVYKKIDSKITLYLVVTKRSVLEIMDTILIPGINDNELLEKVKKAFRRGVYINTVCNGETLLEWAESGKDYAEKKLKKTNDEYWKILLINYETIIEFLKSHGAK